MKGKKEQPAKPKIEIKTRKPEKRGIFANLGENRNTDEHPLREILNFPIEQTEIIPPADFETLPSTNNEGGRPQISHIAVHKSEILPSTNKSVDVLPSTAGNLPSTKPLITGDVDVLPSTLKKSAVHKAKSLPSTKNDRHNKDLARYDNRIDPRTKKQIDLFCAKYDLSQREFAEQSAVHFIELWTAKFARIVDGKTAHDDGLKMIMWKTKIFIINLYRAYNAENKWKFKDDDAAAAYNETDLCLIELGIITTQFNANFKKINSFEYYKNEIDSFVEQKLAPEMLTFLLSHYREKWQKATGKTIDYESLKLEEKGS
ncbi:MAG: hypothetical protein ABJA66_12825 [Actinomycetota bacterium]